MRTDLDKSFSIKRGQKAIELSQMTNGRNVNGERDSTVDAKMAKILEKHPEYRFSELIYISNNTVNTIDAILIVDIIDEKETINLTYDRADQIINILDAFGREQNNHIGYGLPIHDERKDKMIELVLGITNK